MKPQDRQSQMIVNVILWYVVALMFFFMITEKHIVKDLCVVFYFLIGMGTTFIFAPPDPRKKDYRGEYFCAIVMIATWPVTIFFGLLDSGEDDDKKD